MAIVFFEQRKKQQMLILVFVAVGILTAIVVWLGIFNKQPGQEILPSLSGRKIQINYKILEKPVLLKFQLFKEIPDLPDSGAQGRDNPFLPLSAASPPPAEPTLLSSPTP